MKDKNFVMIGAAQDTGGEVAAGQFYDKANATFIDLIDPNHTISTLYNMVNVPTGVWINEEGVLVRPPEVAYSGDVALLSIKVQGSEYVAALRDWVEKGAASEFAMKPEEVAAKITPRTNEELLADSHFKLANHFHFAKNEALSNKHWEAAQKLNPDSWNYHRQDWSFTPQEAGANWMAKYRSLGEKPYYAPLELKKSQK